MYFKKLEIIGFKSFFKKTILNFEPGVTAVVGPNGCGKCLHYGSLVTLSNGSKVKIGELVENALKNTSCIDKLDDGVMSLENSKNIKVLSLNPETLKIEPRPIYGFIKRKAPEYLLLIKTRTGKTVITTHYHPFFSMKDGRIVELKAENLKRRVRIAVPRVLKSDEANSNLKLFEIFKKFKNEDQMYIPNSSQELANFLADVKSKHVICSDTPGALKFNQVAVRSALDGQAMNITNFMAILETANILEIPEFVKSLKSRSSGEIILPRQMNTAIARFLGYLISEGRTTKENQVWFVNEDREIVKDFISSAYTGFGVQGRAFNYKKCAQDVLIFSSALCKFLDKAFDFKISSLSKDKVVPGQIFNSEEKIVTEFLSALFEGDAYISMDRQGSGTYFEYVSASKLLAEGVSSLLLRIGVLSVIKAKKKYAANTKLKKKRLYYSVYVYGIDNVKRLGGLLHFVGKKAQKLDRIKTIGYKTNLNLDLIPEINRSFKALVKLSGLKVKRFKKISPKLVSYYENRCLPTRQGLREALSIVAEHGQITGLAKSMLGYLKILTESDIYWDEIVSIRKIYSQEWVYDLSILGNHNFIAQDMIAHNSNIFDSIRWVLGEQSVKSLRGSEMQDVIFNGTDSKEPLNMAEVTVTFDNEKRFFNLDHQDVAITRRIFRSGESEYLLNRQQVRLKDILDLFMGTGIGAESYSLVEQGKIDLVLSSRPEDRRLVFDEASGITKYKSQKKEALRKLEETEQNLLRVNDIVTEVKRQISSLERQANKARRYKELFEELKTNEVRLALLQKTGLEKEKSEIINQLTGLEVRESGLLTTLKEQESKVDSHKLELKTLEDDIMAIRQELLNLENTVAHNNERIRFNRERITELEATQKYLEAQSEQTRARLNADEEKLNSVKEEHANIKKNIEDKAVNLKAKEAELQNINACLKSSLENIACAKSAILDLASRMSNARNDINAVNSKQQILLARKKRLDIEKAKINEEKAAAEDNLTTITRELEALKASFDASSRKIVGHRDDLEKEGIRLNQANSDIECLEKQRLTLESQREFLNKLKTKYEDINESMNAVIYLDKAPAEGLSGLVVKIRDFSREDGKMGGPDMAFKLSGEAKPIDLDTQRITSELNRIEEKINLLKGARESIQLQITELNRLIQETLDESHNLEIHLANKKSEVQAAMGQFNKIKEEEGIILAELSDLKSELSGLSEKLTAMQSQLSALEKGHRQKEELILEEQNAISLNSGLKEKAVIAITQTKTELDNLAKRIGSDEATLRILEDTYRQDKEALFSLEKQLEEAKAKQEALTLEIKDLEGRISNDEKNKAEKAVLFKEAQARYKIDSEAGSGVLKQIELEKNELGSIKSELYELQMQNKDLDFKFLSLKERMLQNYKVDLDSEKGSGATAMPEDELNSFTQQIKELKEKLDAYGTVNLVAIEEYDELKKRYDFLNQQQADLTQAKESLHEAIQKINRTTKKMFLETFEKVREEFRNYFKLLFNGGDAQIFLIDEQDPLESGIEIICRPPGKKLQNVLLLSGGEKSMSAIALIFAIFKVRPSPFCILDEIDAALDEANVDRFARLLQEFIGNSQFIVITHNKKTIANANVMYGITMEESGVSKIVSVKFGRDKKSVVNEPQVAGVESVS